MNLARILQLVSVLGPHFKTLLPILVAIIQSIKGLPETATIPGFSPSTPPTAEDTVREMVNAGCAEEDAKTLVDLLG